MIEGKVSYPPYTVVWANGNRVFRSFSFKTAEEAIAWAKTKVGRAFDANGQTVFLVTPEHQFKPLTNADLGFAAASQASTDEDEEWEDEDEDDEDEDEEDEDEDDDDDDDDDDWDDDEDDDEEDEEEEEDQ